MTNISSPKITVLMPVYNAERYLREAIESVLGQTYPDFEFLIINDGSSDNSEKIISDYNDPRLRLVNNERNIGLVLSLNKGLTLARGEYIARQDADDISLPTRLEKEINFLKQNNALGMVGTFFVSINEKGERLQEFQLPTDSRKLKQKLLRKNFFAHGSVLSERMHKTCGGYRPELKYCEDYDLWLRISQHYDIANFPESLLSMAYQPKFRFYEQLSSANQIKKTGHSIT